MNQFAQHHEQVYIEVPGSSANLGLYFDKAGVALASPLLGVGLERIAGGSIDVIAESVARTPSSRQRGYAGAVALEQFLDTIGAPKGVRLTYGDVGRDGFPTGGTGLSGAEAVGAVVAASVMFDIPLTAEEVIVASAKGEPAEHKDNVAPSTLGGIVFMSDVPGCNRTLFSKVTPPAGLGLAIGFSSHQKTGGTEGTRNVLQPAVPSDVLVRQVGRAVVGALSLQQGNINGFLQVVSADEYHEPRRADHGAYGGFSASELRSFKQELFQEHHVAMAVSGAGPNMLFWYDKLQQPDGFSVDCGRSVQEWFQDHELGLNIEEMSVAASGAYGYAQQAYPLAALSAAS